MKVFRGKAKKHLRRSPFRGRREQVPRLFSRVFRGKRFTLWGSGSRYDVWKVENLRGVRKRARVILVPSPKRFERSKRIRSSLPALRERYLATKMANVLFP